MGIEGTCNYKINDQPVLEWVTTSNQYTWKHLNQLTGYVIKELLTLVRKIVENQTCVEQIAPSAIPLHEQQL